MVEIPEAEHGRIIRMLVECHERQSVRSLLSEAKLIGVEDGRLIVEVLGDWHVSRLSEEPNLAPMLAAIQELAQEVVLLRTVDELGFNVAKERPPVPTEPKPAIELRMQGEVSTKRLSLITPPKFQAHMTFDRLLVDSANEEVVKIARAVATKEGLRRKRHLYIFGGYGCGKTHLLHAIGNELQKNHPELDILLMSGSGFADGLFASFKAKNTAEFKRQHQSAQVLLVDRAHKLFEIPSEHPRNEFLELLEVLEDEGVQVVMTGMRKPCDLRVEDGAIRTRLEGGWVYELMPPSITTRLHVVRGWFEAEEVPFAEGADKALVEMVEANLRTLEGAFLKLCAKYSLHGYSITPDLVATVARDYTPNRADRKIGYDEVLTFVSTKQNVPVADILSKKRDDPTAYARRLAVILILALVESNKSEVARQLKIDSSSVQYHVREHGKSIEADPDYANVVQSMIASIKG